MSRSVVVAALVTVAAVAGCQDDPTGPILQIEGTYVGAWSFATFDEDGILIGFTVCPGRMTVAEQADRLFGGAYTVAGEGDCAGLSPITGEILEGSVRGDGGVTLVVSNMPVVGPAVAGCAVVSVDNEMVGGVNGSDLSILATAGLECPGGAGSAQIQFDATR